MKSFVSVLAAVIVGGMISLFSPGRAGAAHPFRPWLDRDAGSACASCAAGACAIPAIPSPPATCTAACAPTAPAVACGPAGPAACEAGRTGVGRRLCTGGKRVLRAIGKVLVAPVKLLKRL